jgi:hypothetical protein
MKNLSAVTMLLAFGCVAVLHAQSAAADSSWGKAANNKIFAQKLVNEIMAKNHDLLVVGFHAIAPGAKDQKMIASNLDRIGKEDDDDDKAVVNERKTICVPNAKEPNKFEVQVPMKDATGAIIGAYGFVFQYKAGDDEVELHRKAVVLRDALAQRIPNLAALFAPATL